MSFFKKKRLNDVEGYDRISRLIEDRQHSDQDDEDDADLNEDTVVLGGPSRPAREPVSETVTIVRGAEAREALAADSPPPPREPAFAEPAGLITPSPRMRLPELPALGGGASLVSKDAVWDGKLICTGDVRIEGTLEGEIETSGTLYVAAEARVNGVIRAQNVVLAGEIDGQLRCEQRLEILAGGSARGDIDTGVLVVHEGAFIESKFQMRLGAPAAARP